MASPEETVRVLSIQSHVVHGHVGNRSAVFPLQVLGFEVDAINSVQFSNHTWYKTFKGSVMNAEDLDTLYSGLKTNNIHNYDYVLTGYIGSESFLHKVHDIIKDLKESNPKLIYVCDPVMGDIHDGKEVLYVPDGLLPIFRGKILPLADIILPNQLEAEKLSGQKITNEEEALSVMKSLQRRGPHNVVLTSTSLGEGNKLVSFAATNQGGPQKYVRMEFEKVKAMFIGTGDLFAALWLAWSHVHPGQLQTIANKVQSTMQHVLNRTANYALKAAGDGNTPNWDQVELRLIQSKKDIENPEITIHSQTID